ncbi:MAG: hypothetical protein FJ088_05260 [Deltaproteobacteria bacterium]|nr:hypothetical protein [Deltaproteobacteria bacterium]
MINVFYKGGEKMGWEEPVMAENGEVELNVRVQSPMWMDIDLLEIYANGRPLKFLADESGYIESQDDNASYQIQMVNGGAVKFDETITLLPDKDTWYVFVVKGSKSMAPAGEGVPFAYTNPIYVIQ